MNIRALWPLFLFLTLVIALGIAMFVVDKNKLESELIDQPFPEFELTTLDNPDQMITRDNLKGQITLVNVFGSWCVACVEEHPVLMEIAKDERVRLVGVNWRDKRDKARAWLDRYGDPYDLIVFDEISELAVGIGVTGAPETYILDPFGTIRYKHVGKISPEDWSGIFNVNIEALMDEKG